MIKYIEIINKMLYDAIWMEEYGLIMLKGR